ncbi:palmitoyltransferase ZDHHC23-like [Ptychodera flava]|uniref:palmitoyltransferase ZDHHC23-like n=1 Tax=Ptychodera flava TaxID=63121 RepID=UPI00396A68DF
MAANEESGEPLCCCEYKNVNGEKSHVLAVLCDCEAVDDTCDRYIKCQLIPQENYSKVWEVACDRLRIPWCLGTGAKRIDEVADVTALPAIFVIPLSLYIASLHYYLTFLVLLSLPSGALLYFRQISRLKIRTRFFYHWGIMSVFYIGAVFYGLVVPIGRIGEYEVTGLTLTVLLMFAAFLLSKRNPGIIKMTDQMNRMNSTDKGSQVDDYLQGHRRGVTFMSRTNSTSFDQSGGSGTEKTEKEHSCSVTLDSMNRDNWCEICQTFKPPRAGHCKVCGHCVQMLDHHCVWIDSCVGSENHRSFLCSLILLVIVGIWGSYVSLQTVCTYQGVNHMYVPHFDCQHVYQSQRTALIFTSILYTSAVVIGFTALFLQQSYLVCTGITYREYRFQDYTYYSKNYAKNLMNFVFKRKNSNRRIEI